jgi:hypothetical protein
VARRKSTGRWRRTTQKGDAGPPPASSSIIHPWRPTSPQCQARCRSVDPAPPDILLRCFRWKAASISAHDGWDDVLLRRYQLLHCVFPSQLPCLPTLTLNLWPYVHTLNAVDAEQCLDKLHEVGLCDWTLFVGRQEGTSKRKYCYSTGFYFLWFHQTLCYYFLLV